MRGAGLLIGLDLDQALSAEVTAAALEAGFIINNGQLEVDFGGGWVAITKAVLSDVLEAGRDAKLTGLPPAAAEALKLMYPELVVLPTDSPAVS